MIKNFTLTLFSFFLLASSQAQILRRPVAASYLGLGAYSTNSFDVFSFTSNQASLAEIKHATAGVYGERRFLLNELNNYTAALALPTTSGNFGLNTNYSGFSDYNETKIGLAYGRKLGTKMDIGAQFNYHGIRIAGYGSSSAVSFELGTIIHLTDKLNAGIHIDNPVGGKFGFEEEEKLPSVYSFGAGYDVSDKFFISAEIQKEEDQPVNINAGFEYKIAPQLFVRAGMQTATSSEWAGVGINLKSFRIDVTAGYHPQLGVTPGLLLVFNFNNSNNNGN